MIVKLAESSEYTSGAVAIDQPKFSLNVDRKPYSIAHDLSDHPLLQLESLIELSQRMPAHLREYVFAKQEFCDEEFDRYLHAGENDELSTVDMIQDIEAQNRIIVLRNVETDPIYGQFVNDCLDDLKSQVEPWTGPMSGRESYIFISPPRAYTPYHYDPEQNFFLQIRGQKQMAIYDVNDRKSCPKRLWKISTAEDRKL